MCVSWYVPRGFLMQLSINWVWRLSTATLHKSSLLDFYSANQWVFITSQSCSIGSIGTIWDVQYTPLILYSTFTWSLPCLQVTFRPQRAFNLEFLLTLVLLLLRTLPTSPLCFTSSWGRALGRGNSSEEPWFSWHEFVLSHLVVV